MTIHVVRPGESVDSIAAGYGVSPRRLAVDNALPGNLALAVGQTLVVRFPREVHAVAAGETLTSIAASYGTSVRQLWRNNWELGGGEMLQEGQLLVISYFEEKLARACSTATPIPSSSPPFWRSSCPISPLWHPSPTESPQEGAFCPWTTKRCWRRPGPGGPSR